MVRNADAKSVIELAGEIVPREMMCLSLSFDHRIVDCGEATRFLNEVVRRIEASAI